MSESLTNDRLEVGRILPEDARQLPGVPIPVDDKDSRVTEMGCTLPTEEADPQGISRRGLFKMLASRGKQLAANPIPPDSPFASWPVAPPIPDTIEKLGAWQNIKVNRRPILAGLAYLALCANSAFRQYLDGSYPRIEPELISATGEIPDQPEQVAFFFPGFGDMHTVPEMKDLLKKGEFPRIIPLLGFNESQYDATPQEKARLAREKIDMSNLRSVILFGSSMGGQDLWEFAAYLGVPVEKIYMFSSPFSLADGFDGEIGKLFKHVPIDRELAFVGKLIYGWQHAKRKNGLLDIIGNAETAWHMAITGDDPVTLEKRAKASLNNNIWRLVRSGRFKGIIDENTDVYYTDAEDPRKDPTVHVVHSCDEFRKVCDYLHARFHHLPIKEGHANVKQTAIILAPFLQKLRRKPEILADGGSR